MKSKYLYLAAGVGFAIFALWQYSRDNNTTAAMVAALTGAIFLFLGLAPKRS